MKTALISALVVLTQTALPSAQATPQATPPPPRFCITLEAVEVSGDKTYSVTPGAEPAAGVLEEMLKKGGAELTEVSLITPNDFMTFSAPPNPAKSSPLPSRIKGNPH